MHKCVDINNSPLPPNRHSHHDHRHRHYFAIRFFCLCIRHYEYMNDWMNENICIYILYRLFQLLVKLSKITYSKFIWCDWMIAWCCPLVFIRSKVVITFSLHCAFCICSSYSHPHSWKKKTISNSRKKITQRHRSILHDWWWHDRLITILLIWYDIPSSHPERRWRYIHSSLLFHIL